MPCICALKGRADMHHRESIASPQKTPVELQEHMSRCSDPVRARWGMTRSPDRLAPVELQISGSQRWSDHLGARLTYSPRAGRRATRGRSGGPSQPSWNGLLEAGVRGRKHNGACTDEYTDFTRLPRKGTETLPGYASSGQPHNPAPDFVGSSRRFIREISSYLAPATSRTLFVLTIAHLLI